MALTANQLLALFNGYNNVSQKTVNDFVDYIFNGIVPAAGGTITGDLTVNGNVITNSIEQRTTAGLVIGASGNKLGFYGTTAQSRSNVSNIALTDLASVITVLGNVRTALGDGTGGTGLVHLV